jgi:hypothetical protein
MAQSRRGQARRAGTHRSLALGVLRHHSPLILRVVTGSHGTDVMNEQKWTLLWWERHACAGPGGYRARVPGFPAGAPSLRDAPNVAHDPPTVLSRRK